MRNEKRLTAALENWALGSLDRALEDLDDFGLMTDGPVGVGALLIAEELRKARGKVGDKRVEALEAEVERSRTALEEMVERLINIAINAACDVATEGSTIELPRVVSISVERTVSGALLIDMDIAVDARDHAAHDAVRLVLRRLLRDGRRRDETGRFNAIRFPAKLRVDFDNDGLVTKWEAR